MGLYLYIQIFIALLFLSVMFVLIVSLDAYEHIIFSYSYSYSLSTRLDETHTSVWRENQSSLEAVDVNLINKEHLASESCFHNGIMS